MNKDWMKNFTAVGFALALAATPAAAAVDDWNTDDAAGISNEEFSENFGAFDSWDANEDGWLSDDEFDAGASEAGDGFTERFGDEAYADWDADENDELTEEEFDGGVYSAYDEDENGVIEEPEFGDLNDDMGDGGFWDV